MKAFNITTAQWGAGGYCAFSGLLMLVIPHQFLAPAYVALQPVLWLWGLLFLLAGSFMLVVALLKLPRRATVIAHLLTGASLLLLAAGFVNSRLWSATINLSVLGVGTLLVAFPFGAATGERRSRADLLSLLVGLGMIGNGLLMLLVPTQYSAPLYVPIHSFLGIVGLAFVLGGVLLVYQQLRPGKHGATILRRIAYAVAAAILFSFLPIALIGQTWSGIPYYGVIAILVALTPWQDRIGWRIDGGALRTRLALAMALVAAVPLILMTAWFSGRVEQETRQEARDNMQIQAAALAASMQNYANEHSNAVLTLAANPDLLALAPAAQRSVLQVSARAYPDIVAFSTFDLSGAPLARSDSLPLTPILPGVLDGIMLAGGPFDMVVVSPLLHRPVFLFGAPSMRPDGALNGIILVAVESSRVSASLARATSSAGSIVYLVDSTGRVIAHPDPALVAGFADLSATSPVAAFLALPESSGALSYSAPATERLAGYAAVPGFGWGVIVEQPVASALAATRAEREQLLLLVLLFLLAAAAAGMIVARSLTAPLSDLVAATAALADGDRRAPLPASDISELDGLARAFGEMRERIAARTAERQQAQAALQTLNGELERLVTARTAALNQTNARLEQQARELERSNAELAQFAYVASHDLKEPLRMMASYSQLLARRYEGRIDAKADRYIDYISEGAARMQLLIDDLLGYARVGRAASQLEPLDLDDALHQALVNLQLLIAENDATVTHDKLPTVLGDKLQLISILQNLIHNALKFHGHDKPIIAITARRDRAYWEICVRDNGIGIDPQYQERIFTIFQRLHSRQKYAGNGIGLAIVKKLVEHHEGSIWVKSIAGEGAAFFFTIQALKD